MRTSSKAVTTPKILIVDDNEFMRWAIRDMIKKCRPEWNVCGEAANGEEAIQAAISLEPDVIVLDQSMPGMTGLSAAAQIAKLHLKARVLLLTAYELADLANPSTTPYTYVDKSNASRDLVPAIESVIANQRRRKLRPGASDSVQSGTS